MVFASLSDTPGSTSAGSISPEFVTDTDRVLVSKAATLDDPYNAAIMSPGSNLLLWKVKERLLRAFSGSIRFKGSLHLRWVFNSEGW